MRHRLASVGIASLLALVPLGATPHARTPIPAIPVFGPSVHLLDPSRYPSSDANYPGQALPDDEPSLAIAPDGTVWVAALHMHDGTALWRGRFGQAPPTFVGMPDRGIGGSDVALAVSTGTPATLYAVSLVPVTTPVTAWRVAATTCSAGLVAPNFAPCIFYPHLAYGLRDRPWLAASGRSTAYLSYMERSENELSGHMTMRRSDDGGRTWTQTNDPIAPFSAASGPVHGWSGTIAVDEHTDAVYEAFVVEGADQRSADRFNRFVVAVSHDRGATWRDVTAYHGGPHEDDGHMWPGLAIDAAGWLYAAWSDGRGIYLSRSTDGAATWSAPLRVDAPTPLLETSVMPWIAAGAPGHVALAWYGTSAANGLAAHALWRVWYAESSNAGRNFARVPVTGIIHRGPVCAKGDECPWSQRQLLDNLGLALDPRSGRAAIAYARSIEFGNYTGCRLAANCPQTYYVEEVGH